jgi:hypothetical protein
MSYFEYKVVPAPTTGRRAQRRVDGLDKYASTVSDIMTELGLEGWDFIGAEQLRERRRRFFFLVSDVERTLMVFRREVTPSDARADLHLEDQPTAEPMRAALAPVTPRRVTRPDLVEAVAAGARRVPLRTADASAAVSRSGNAGTGEGQVAAE